MESEVDGGVGATEPLYFNAIDSQPRRINGFQIAMCVPIIRNTYYAHSVL